VSESKGSPATPQDVVGDLTPFLILPRNSGGFSVAARASDGTIHIAPLIAVPDPPRKRLIQCPCKGCGRWIVWSEWPSGVATLTPLSQQRLDDDIPF
jgi:hypothetical protein